MFGLDQSPRYACRSTSPPPPAPLPRSGFVQRPNLCHLIGLSTGFHTTGVAVSNLLSFDRPLIA